MTEIKRYEFDILDCNGGSMRQSPRGGYVIYKDHAAIVAVLQEQVRALAAENADLKDINSWCRTEAFQNMYREFKTAEAIGCADVDCMHDAMLAAIMHAPKTPATDAALREIRADGAMACGVHLREWYDYQVEERAEEFAAAIRAGEQL